MNIRFGTNEYTLVPGSAVQEYNDNLEVQILADEVDLESLEAILLDSNNTSSIVIVDENSTRQIYENWGKLLRLRKEYNILYWTEIAEQIITPEEVDPETGEIITPQEIEYETIEHRADIIYINLTHPGLESQVETNTANIEFLAIMSDIDL